MSQRQTSIGCLILFALPFAGVGFGTGVVAGWMLVQSYEASSWDRVPATILSTNLALSSGSEGGSTYRCEATYEYEVHGNVIRGDRVGLLSMSDNIGSWHARKHAELSRLQSTGEQISCYVDPDDEWNSLLYPEVRLELLAFLLLFALIFGGVGVGIVVGVLWKRRKASTEGELETHRPDEPWLWREDWVGGRVVSGRRGAVGLAVIVALAWNAISAPVLFLVPEAVRDGNHLALIALVFPLVGLCLILWALHAIAGWRKYGESVLQLATTPAYAGGRLNGIVHINRNLPAPPSGFGLRLSCLRKVVVRSKDGSSTHEETVWQAEQRVMQELASDDTTCTLIPVSFPIPDEIAECRTEEDGDDIVWRLEVSAEVPGVDYSGRFEVPVFEPRGEVDLEALGQTKDIAVSVRGEAPVEESLRTARVRARERIGGGLELYYPPARNLGQAIVVTIFAVLWNGGLALTIHKQAPVVFPILLGAVDLLVLYGFVNCWFGSWLIEVSSYSVVISRRTLGLGRTRSVQAEDITGIDCKTSNRTGNQSYYVIEVHTEDGAAHSAGDGIPGLAPAEAVVAQMKAALESR